MASFPYMQFQTNDPVGNALEKALGVYQGLNQGQAQRTQTQLNQAQLPYAQQNARYDALNKELSARYAPQKAAMDFQKLTLDMEKAAAELRMYPENQNNQNNYRRAMADMADFKRNNPESMGSGPGKDIWTLQQSRMRGNPNQPQSPQQRQPGMPQQQQIPQQQNMNPQGPSEDQFAQALETQINQLGKTGAQKASEEQWAVQDVKAYTGTMDKLSEQAEIASMENQDLDAVSNMYGRLSEAEIGTWLGQLPEMSGASNLVKSLESGLVLNELKEQKGTASEGDRKSIENKYGGKVLSKTDKEELLLLRKIMNNRKIEKQGYFADRKGEPVEQIEKEWNKKLKNESIFKDPQYQLFEFDKKIKNMTPQQRIKAIEEQQQKVREMTVTDLIREGVE